MGGIFSAPSQPAVEPLPPPPTKSDAEVQQAALDVRRRRAGAIGRSDTIKTSGQGVVDGADTVSTQLLGESP